MDHLDEFNRLLTKLDATDAKIDEEDKTILLSVSLPLSYEHLKTMLMHVKYNLEMDGVVTTLISYKSMRERLSEKILNEGVMVASDGQVKERTTERKDGFKLRGCSQSKGLLKPKGRQREGKVKGWSDDRELHGY